MSRKELSRKKMSPKDQLGLDMKETSNNILLASPFLVFKEEIPIRKCNELEIMLNGASPVAFSFEDKFKLAFRSNSHHVCMLQFSFGKF